MSLSEKLHTKTGKVITGLVSLIGLKAAADVTMSGLESYINSKPRPGYVLQLTQEQLDSMQSKAYANNESRDYTKMGDKKLEAGEIDSALRLYQFAVDADPKDERAQERLRVAQGKAGGDAVKNSASGRKFIDEYYKSGKPISEIKYAREKTEKGGTELAGKAYVFSKSTDFRNLYFENSSEIKRILEQDQSIDFEGVDKYLNSYKDSNVMVVAFFKKNYMRISTKKDDETRVVILPIDSNTYQQMGKYHSSISQ